MRYMVCAIVVIIAAGSLLAGESPLGSPDFVPSRTRPYGWRGDGSGRFVGATQPPLKWNLATGENVRWKVPINIRTPLNRGRIEGSPYKWNRVEGEITKETKVSDWLEGSYASPVLLDDRVVTLSEPNWVICVAKDDGKELWRREFPMDRLDASHADYVLNHTSGYNIWRFGWTMATPVTDNASIWVSFGFGAVARYDRDGKLLWTGIFNVYRCDRNGQPNKKAEPPSAIGSPVLCANPGGDGADPAARGTSVLVTCGRDIDAFVGWNADTGERLWTLRRPGGNKPGYDPHATPAVIRIEGGTLLVTVDGWVVAPRTGEVLQRLFDPSGTQVYASPIVMGDVVVLQNNAPRAIQAYRLTGRGKTSQQLWSWQPGGQPIRFGGAVSPLWMDHGTQVLVKTLTACQMLAADTGAVLFDCPLKNNGTGSPTLAAGLVYLIGTEATIARPGTGAAEVVASFPSGFVRKPNHHGFGVFNSPVFEGRRMYFRDLKALYCIEEKK